jgi:hypothetical protein
VWRSRTSTCTASAIAVLVALAGACGKRSDAIAELIEATGPVERQVGHDAWKPAQVAATFALGDAARIWDGTATLDVEHGAARIVMRDHTVLRFGGRPGASKIAVEAGSIDLTGTGSYALDIGDIKLPRNGTVRITARGEGRSTIELTIGDDAQITSSSGTIDLTVNKPVELGGPTDAGVPVDARPPPPPDAAVDAAGPVAGDATIDVTGKRAEVLAAGATAWQPLPAGASALARGSAVRLGPGTTAKVTAATTSLELAGGSRIKLGDDLAFTVELGGVRAQATAAASVALPGGAVALQATPAGAVEARLDAGPRETRITMQRGGSNLTGAPGAELAMNRGETATLTRTGAIRVVDAIPGYFDFRVGAGESLTIHDPRPPTAVQFQFDGRCPDGGIVEVDRDGRFRTAKVSAGKDFANVLIPAGSWSYRLRCTRDGDEGAPVATGRVSAVRDDGRRPLPKNQGVNDIDADGRNYRISYQSAIPNVAVHVKNPGAAHRLHLASGGKEQTFDSSTATITVPGAQLHEGAYSYWVDRDGVKQDKVSSLTIDFDQTAPQVYIESPANGQPWTGDLDVRGAVLPGWSAAVEAIAIPVDRQRRFSAKVGAPAGTALAIKLSHPQRGIHYYLRRQK